jgi:uncharacterized membrane protein YphA (DoxX/SURF4 family)
MNIALWILQIILGIKLISASFSHSLGQSKPTMQEAIGKMGLLSRPMLILASIGTFIGTAGLILPGLLKWAAWLTPVTAGLDAIMLLCSIFFHLRAREKPMIFVSLVLFAFAVFVAYGRWALVPFG